MKHRFAALALALLLAANTSAEEEEDIVDFSDMMTPVCEVHGLSARPPGGWINVPIESDSEAVRGCQMMRIREEGRALVGILRLLSVRLPEPPDDAPWWAMMIGLETGNIAVMGYTLGEVLWSRENVPIQGDGFSGARAVGMASRIEGNDIPQETHFLVFERDDTKYIVTLLTAAREVEKGVYYDRNTADFGVLIRGFNRAAE